MTHPGGERVTNPAGERIVRPVRRHHFLRAAMTERLPTKLAALLLAFVLWAVVRGEESTEIIIGVRFVATVDSTLMLTGPVPDSVQVVVTGRRREVLKLRANPPVLRRRFDEDTPRRMRVNLLPTDVEFPVGVEATARSVRPASVTLSFRPRPAPAPQG
jgi:hypothetical protein